MVAQERAVHINPGASALPIKYTITAEKSGNKPRNKQLAPVTTQVMGSNRVRAHGRQSPNAAMPTRVNSSTMVIPVIKMVALSSLYPE